MPVNLHLLADEALLAQCRVDRMRGGGPGGQHLQKTESAVRLVHEASGVEARCADHRHHARNCADALRRLRLRLALAQADGVDPAWIEPFRQGRRLVLGAGSPNYPKVVAVVMHALQHAAGSPAEAAKSLNLSTSQVVKLLADDKEALAAANALRATHGLEALRG